MKILRKNKKVIIGIVLGLFIGLSATASAATLIASNNVTYSNTNTSATNVKGALDELLNEKSQLNNRVKLGDYIQMTPTLTSYKIAKELSGTSYDQTMNPRELNLWRVISINEDGTIDVISEYATEYEVELYGYTGFINANKVLINVANSFANTKYTNSARMIGSNLKEDNFTYLDSVMNEAKYSTLKYQYEYRNPDNTTVSSYSSETSQLYVDLHSIYKSLGTLNSKRIGESWPANSYYLGYQEVGCNKASNKFYCNGKIIYTDWEDEGTSASDTFLTDESIVTNEGNTKEEYINNRKEILVAWPVRPILVLNSGITGFTGDGTESNPYVLR